MNTDRASLRRRVILEVASSTKVLLPLIAGTSFLLGAWTFSITGGVVIFAGIASLLLGVGMFCTSILSGAATAVEKIQKKIAAETVAQAEAELDALDRQLATDGDGRSQEALRDLRSLRKAIFEIDCTTVGFDLSRLVEELFNGCVASLKHQYSLCQTVKTIRTEKARKPIEKQRDKIIKDVVDTVAHISNVIAQSQSIGSQMSAPLLEDKKKELDDTLNIARRVSERMMTWQTQIE